MSEKLILNPKPQKGEDGNKTFSIRIRNEIVEKLDRIAANSGYSRNELIGIFLEFACDNCEIKKGE